MPYKRFQKIVLVLSVAFFSSFITYTLMKGDLFSALVDLFIFIIILAALYGGRQLAWVSFLFLTGLHALIQFFTYPIFTTQNLNLFLQHAVLYGLIALIGGEIFTWLKYKLPEIEHLALTDPETGVWNAKQIKEILHKEMEKERRYGARFSLIEINVQPKNGAKFQKTFLKNLGSILAKNIRVADEAGRIDENSFLVVLPHTSREGAEIAAKRLYKMIEDIIPYEENQPLFEVKFNLVPVEHESLMRYLEKGST